MELCDQCADFRVSVSGARTGSGKLRVLCWPRWYCTSPTANSERSPSNSLNSTPGGLPKRLHSTCTAGGFGCLR